MVNTSTNTIISTVTSKGMADSAVAVTSPSS